MHKDHENEHCHSHNHEEEHNHHYEELKNGDRHESHSDSSH